MSCLLFHLLFFPLSTGLQAILNGFLADFYQAVKDCTAQIVDAAVEIYNRLSVDLLPTPAKSHYVFNLRDLSKCVQGEIWAQTVYTERLSVIVLSVLCLFSCKKKRATSPPSLLEMQKHTEY